MTTTRIEISTNPYNQRRCGKPWIARVDFSIDPRGEFKWGTWIGDALNGSEGLLIIDAAEGDIIASGQKDHRQPRNSAPDYYQVVDGQLVPVATRAAAYKLATARHDSGEQADERAAEMAAEDALTGFDR